MALQKARGVEEGVVIPGRENIAGVAGGGIGADIAVEENPEPNNKGDGCLNVASVEAAFGPVCVVFVFDIE